MSDLPAKLLEDKLLRSLRAKRRFRAIIRQVMKNTYWLLDDDGVEIQEFDDLKKKHLKMTVNRLTKKQKTGIISIREKGILRKHSKIRTEEEKILLNKYLSGLKCFRRYPEEVTFKLIAVSYFEYYGPDRVLMRQNYDAFGMYAILTGEVIITKEVYDEIEKKWFTEELGKITAGNMFGEVSLLHDAKRTATVTTITPCEFLLVKKDDFNNVLKATIKARWDEIHESMKKFNYFDTWDKFTIQECCILSKIKCYEPNQVILGDGIGRSSQAMVYFVIEGTCALIEHLFITETVKNGIKNYKLYNPEMLVDKSSNKRLATELLIDTEIERYDDISLDEDTFHKHCYPHLSITDPEIRKSFNIEELLSQNSGIGFPSIQEIREIGQSIKKSVHEQKQLNAGNFKNCFHKLPENVKLRFMQVCTFSEKSTFMNNKILEYRRMIAITPVKCILVPSYWLSQHNKGNIWTRVSTFIKGRVPTRSQVFRKYVSNRKWNDYKKKLVHDILRNKKFVNSTTIHDVPYSIRVKNEVD